MAAHFKAALSAWADDIGMAVPTLRNKLRLAGTPVYPGKLFTTEEIFKAVTAQTAKEIAQTREANARAEKVEKNNAKQFGNMLSRDEVEKLLTLVLTPIRQRIDTLPDECGHLCNPTDPEFARIALRDWVKQLYPYIRRRVAEIELEEKGKVKTDDDKGD